MEALTEDGAFSVDVLMRAERIALEVRLPSARAHFREPHILDVSNHPGARNGAISHARTISQEFREHPFHQIILTLA